MSDAKHTKGPWTYYEWPNGFTISQEGGAKNILSHLCGKDGPNYLPERADLRLIAAAPDLLEACEVVMETLCEPGEYELSEVAHRHGVMQAAIRRAKEGK